jgi:WD40 repeat protein
LLGAAAALAGGVALLTWALAGDVPSKPTNPSDEGGGEAVVQPTPTERLDPKLVAEGLEALRELKRERDLAFRLERLEDWLKRYRHHPDEGEARRLRDEARQHVPLAVGEHPHVEHLAFLPGGIVSSGRETTIRRFKSEGGRLVEVRRWSFPSEVFAMNASATGEVVAAAFGRDGLGSELVLIDPDRDEPLRQVRVSDTDPVYALAVDPGGTRLALSLVTNPAVLLFSIPTLEPAGRLEPHGGRVRSLAFSPDGKQLVTACGGSIREGGEVDNSVRVWDLERSWLLGRQALTGKARRVIVAPTGDRAYVGTSIGQIAEVDLATCTITRYMRNGRLEEDRDDWGVSDGSIAHLGAVWGLAVSRSGHLYSAAKEDGVQLVRTWDLASGKPLHDEVERPARSGLERNVDLAGMTLRPDERAVAIWTSDGRIEVWARSER